MIFYRVENDEGMGAYSLPGPEEDLCGPMFCDEVMYLGNGSKIHPTPDNDPLLKDIDFYEETEPYSWYFCFESLEALHNWFYAPIMKEKLHEAGAAISVIEAEVYVLGEKQAIYCRNHDYIILERIPLV